MKWWKIEMVPYSPGADNAGPPAYAFGEDLTTLIMQRQLYGHSTHYPVGNEVEPSEVPSVQRGLTEASLEELFKEVNARGFKVVQQ